MQGLLDFFAKNKDGLTIVLQIISIIGGVLVAIWGVWKLIIERFWKQHLRIEIKVFDVVTDPAKLLPRLFNTENDNSPLADHNILYQPRVKDRDIQGELRAALNKKRYLLVTAPTGYGKTREGGMLAKSLMDEGYRVVLTRTGWVENLKELPAEFDGNRSRIVLFLDDLNGLFRTGGFMQSPRAEQMPITSQPSYHDRLLDMLNAFEEMCGAHEIRVIATARSEAEEWKTLGFNEDDKLWKRFERFELPRPQIESVVDLLENTTKTTDVKAREVDFDAIARKNDGTYRNVILNLRRAKNESSEINQETYKDTLNGSWREIYERDLSLHPSIKYIYSAMLILRQARIELFTITVLPIAKTLSGKNKFKQFLLQRDIHQTLRYLVGETKILPISGMKIEPHDGQIEACDSTEKWETFSDEIERLLVDLSRDYKDILKDSLFNLAKIYDGAEKKDDYFRMLKRLTKIFPDYANSYFLLGAFLEEQDRIDEAEIAIRQALKKTPNNADAYLFLGILLKRQSRLNDAEIAFRQAIEKEPNNDDAYFMLGSVFYPSQKRFKEAEIAFRQAIEKNPDNVAAYALLGSVLHAQKQFEEAEIVFRQAIEKDSDDAKNYSMLGHLLKDQKRFDEAERAYRTAIEKDPDESDLPELGLLLRLNRREEEALLIYEKSIKIEPDNYANYLAIASIQKQLGNSEKSQEYVEKSRLIIPKDDWYNLACLESIAENIDMAFEYLQKAAQLENFNPAWAWQDPDLQWLRDDPRFLEIVGPRPEK